MDKEELKRRTKRFALVENRIAGAASVTPLMKEAGELLAIVVPSINTARRNKA